MPLKISQNFSRHSPNVLFNKGQLIVCNLHKDGTILDIFSIIIYLYIVSREAFKTYRNLPQTNFNRIIFQLYI